MALFCLALAVLLVIGYIGLGTAVNPQLVAYNALINQPKYKELYSIMTTATADNLRDILLTDSDLYELALELDKEKSDFFEQSIATWSQRKRSSTLVYYTVVPVSYVLTFHHPQYICGAAAFTPGIVLV